MDDRAALLAAVCARPDDDTPRLVFADWCDDHGAAEYARFIRAEVELARVPEWDQRAVRARHRDRDLFSWRRYHEHARIPLDLRAGLEFRRGFPWGVTFPSPRAFADRADEVFALGPVQSLTIRSDYRQPPPDLTPLTADPRSAQLRRLAFRTTRLDAAAVRRLADSPHLAGVTELEFEYDAITASGLDQLFESRLLDRLGRLRLHNNDPLPATALRGYGGTTALRSLAVTHSSLAGPYLAETFAGPLFRGLAELDLSFNRLGPAGVAALAASPAAATLESLTLRQTAAGVAGVRALAASPALTNLRRLDLSEGGLGPVAAKALAESPHLANLAVLDLARNEIGDKGGGRAGGVAASAELGVAGPGRVWDHRPRGGGPAGVAGRGEPGVAGADREPVGGDVFTSPRAVRPGVSAFRANPGPLPRWPPPAHPV